MTGGFLGHEQEGLRHEGLTCTLEHMSKDYELAIGKWVTARCKKRVDDTRNAMPQVVKDWLDHGGSSAADENTKPTLTVVSWLVMTIDDPDWPEG